MRTTSRQSATSALTARRGRLLTAAALVGVLVAPTSPAWSPATATEPAPPPTLTGAAPTGADVTGVTVLAMPTDRAMRNAANGAQLPLAPVTPAAVTTDGNRFTLTLAPENVPAANTERLGLTHLELLVATAAGTYTATASLRAVVDAATQAPRFAEPATSAPTGTPTFYRVAHRSLPTAPATADTTPVTVSGLTQISETDAGATITAAGPTAPAGCSYTKLRERTRPSIIGTTYPVGGDKAKMVVGSSTGAHYGTAVSAKDSSGNWGSFRAGSEKYTRNGWGKSWDGLAKSRAYRKGLEYGLFRLNCARGCWNCRKQWYPIGETGGTSSIKGIRRPSWGHCVREDPGRWWRDESGGKAYTRATSVQFKGIIGIDLSISRQYNSDQKLLYRFTRIRRLCGSNDWPSTAGNVMERLRR